MKTRKLMRVMPIFWWIVMAAILGVVVMLLWNWIIPSVFGLGMINYWQALGLFVLARVLFGGFRGKRMHGMMHGVHGHHNPIREKWMNMSPEERKEFIRKRREHMHGGPFGKHDFFGEQFEKEAEAGSNKDAE